MTKYQSVALGIFFDSLRPLKAITIPLCLIASIAFFFQSDSAPSSDLEFLTSKIPSLVWGLLFAYATASRVVGLFIWPGNKLTRIATPVLSIWLWSMLLFSSAIASPAESMSPLYLVPILIEFWILAQYLDQLRRGMNDPKF